jgi:tetratricopeptide (TPR) repeat protein
MPVFPRWRSAAAAAFLTGGCALVAVAADAPDAAETPIRSALDAPLFYQLLIGELELRGGEAGTSYSLILEAARRTGDEALFRRSVDIALQARAGEQALAATQAWRSARPESVDALRLQLQILAALNRLAEASEPLRALLSRSPPAERPSLIVVLPRFLQRATDRRQTATLLDEVLKPYVADKSTATAARVASGRAWLAAGDVDRALALAEQAHRADPASGGPALLALELMPQRPQAEAVVIGHLAQPGAEVAMRLNYARALTQAQRFPDALRELQAVTRQQPTLATPYLSIGAIHLELRQFAQADAALKRYLALAQPDAAAAAASDDDEEDESRPEQGLVQAWLLLAQSAEHRGDYAAAERWLAQVTDPQRALEVQARRASLLARQGQVEAARKLITALPEREASDARAKMVAEAGLLRDVKRWREAFDVLADASQRFTDDADLLYEQAMMAEKLDRLDEMERLLRRVIALKPDSAQAYNALGYSLADRGQRLPEARQLIQRALELQPGDPFVIDSLGWVEYRLGNAKEALRLLRQAYAARPDIEIAAHLGEVLWSLGERDEARRIWRDAGTRDAANDVLRETLTRLRVKL